jgi:hypothetical protein
MQCLDERRLAQVAGQSSAFLNQKPYPWIGLQRVLQEDAFGRLCAELPRHDLFKQEFGQARDYGQQSHDRYALQYHPRLDAELAPSWRAFIADLRSERYGSFIREMYGLGASQRFELSMHWHHAANGGSVSPHTDARRKIGSHIFYFNTAKDWEPAWGGQTVVLDDGGRLSAHASPKFGELPQIAASEILGNRSFMFRRTEHSWHAVNPITCPPDRMRKVFIVVVNRIGFQVLWRRLRGKDPDGYPL